MLLPSAHAEIRVALDQIEITPPIGSPMAGYTARKGVAESIHDPLMAGVILLQDAQTSVAILTFDLRRLTCPQIIEGVKKLGIQHVILASSHDHSGPDADNETFPTPETSWRRATETKVIEMVKRAQGNMFPARFAFGAGETYLGHNRRLVNASGKATMFWRNAEMKPTHPIDPTVTVIRIDDAEGNARAAIVHYACHAVVLGPDNLAISADYPGAMRGKLASLISSAGGKAPSVFFLQGAAGDINPYHDKQPVNEGAFDEVQRVGGQLAEAAFKVYQAIAKNLKPINSIKVSEAAFSFENRWKPEEKIASNLTTILIGSEFALAALPGEPFINFQLDLSARAPVKQAIIMGYSVSGPHAWPGYIPTIEAATQGGYGAGYNTTIEVGAGERLVDRAVIDIYKMKGILDGGAKEIIDN